MNEKLLAQCLAQTAGLTPQSSSRRLYIDRFRMGGARVYRDQGQPRETWRGQDDWMWKDDYEREHGARVALKLEEPNGQE